MAGNPQLSAGDWFFGKVLRMGANWQTTLSGIGAAVFFGLTTLAGLSYQFGDVANFLPPTVKKWVTIISAAATVVLKIWNSLAQKSKNVTGGNTQQTLDGELAKPGTQNLVDLTAQAPPAK
jgi:hypothetical protein